MCQCPALYGCGALYRLFQFRSFHNLQADIRNQLHTFLFFNYRIGVATVIASLNYEKVIVIMHLIFILRLFNTRHC